MKNVLCKGGAQRGRWAVSLCFASATIMALEASRPDACAWLGFNSDQSFAISAVFATVSVFLATFILAQLSSTPATVAE